MPSPDDWRSEFRRLLPLFGHRNWILVADAAFPAQVGAVQVLATGEDHLSVVGEVIAALKEAPHVRPIVWLDAELNALSEALAPGTEALRTALAEALQEQPPTPRPHAELLERLLEVAQSYRVLVLKTDSLVPYSSVFLELDCGYWSPESEAALRSVMG
jgi:hypothetical protein